MSAVVVALSQRVGVVLQALSPDTRLSPLAVLFSAMMLLGGLGLRIGGQAVAFVSVASVCAVPALGPGMIQRRDAAAARRLLPERVARVARSLRSGSMLADALRTGFPVGQTGAAPWVAGLDQMALGRPVDEVLVDLSTHAESQERMFIAALRMGQHSGGRRVASLESLAERLSAEVDLEDRRRVLTTQARVSAQVLAALPVAFAVVLAAIRGGTAYTGTIGAASLIGGSLLNVVGLAWMRRQLRVLR